MSQHKLISFQHDIPGNIFNDVTPSRTFDEITQVKPMSSIHKEIQIKEKENQAKEEQRNKRVNIVISLVCLVGAFVLSSWLVIHYFR